MSGPRYSVCITNYNSGKTIQLALGSILSQFNGEDFEIVAVDNASTDTSIEVLRELKQKRILRELVVTKCNRGRGRQIAFEISTAPYILSNLDMDIVYAEGLKNVLATYHERYEGKVFCVHGMSILPRELVVKLGGWRNLDRNEDVDLYIRAYNRRLLVLDTSINVRQEHLKTRTMIKRLVESYENYRDWFRIGMRINDLPRGPQFLMHPTVLLAFITYRFYPQYPNEHFSEWLNAWNSGKYQSPDPDGPTLNAPLD